MKIKNPYSKKRYTLKDRLSIRVLTRIGNKLIKLFPDNFKLRRLFGENITTDSKLANNEYFNLVNICLFELVPKENLKKLREGLKKIVKKYNTNTSLNFQKIDSIDSFCNDSINDLFSSGWSYLASIEFSKDNYINEFISEAHIYALYFTSSIVCIKFSLIPSESFKHYYNNFVKNNAKCENIYTNSSIKNIFKLNSWVRTTKSNISVKEKQIRDLIIELKWRFSSRINIFIPLFFYSNDILSSSIEVYKTNIKHQIKCKNAFWRSVGIESIYTDLSQDGSWAFQKGGVLVDDIDNEYKLIVNDELLPSSIYSKEYDYNIIQLSNEFANDIFEQFIVESIVDGFSKKLSNNRNKVFKYLSKKI